MFLSEHIKKRSLVFLTIVGGFWLLPLLVKAVDGNDLQLREAEQLALDLDPLSKGFVT
ncbi:MAG: hypothetical protein HW386_2592, partial [Gammaproteobacteria bacterium]|nr:hypothetical protein [Gammaproteobacteria bacterium]